MKRCVFKLPVLLLLGAIINVAVAWGCALAPTNDWNGATGIPDGEAHALWRRYAPADWPSAPDEGDRLVNFGRIIRNAHLLDEAYSSDNFVGYVHTWDVMDLDAGWPLLAMRLDALHRSDGGYDDYPDVFHHAWILLPGPSDVNKAFYWLDGRVPIELLWPGFAINTMFYVAILWLPFAAFGKFRRSRRINRSLCPACAYPIRESAVCTECGQRIRQT